MLERSHLEILRALHRQPTLTEAAKALHLSQSALSHAIRKLEQQSGAQIWKKKGRRLELTEAGEFLLELADRILPQLEHAESTLSRFAQGKKGSLRIGMECHPCYQWLLTVVLPYLQAWPEVDVDIKKGFQFDGLKALKDHEIDLLITPDPSDDDELEFTPVFNYELVLLVMQGHHLSIRTHAEPQDLKKETLLTYPVPNERLDILRNFLLPAHCRPGKQRIVEDSDIMVQMVAAGRGVTALPDWIAREYVEILPIKALRLGPEGLKKKVYTSIRKNDAAVDYINAFVNHACSAGAEG